MTTVSMTWMTPFEPLMSAAVTMAARISEADRSAFARGGERCALDVRQGRPAAARINLGAEVGAVCAWGRGIRVRRARVRNVRSTSIPAAAWTTPAA